MPRVYTEQVNEIQLVQHPYDAIANGNAAKLDLPGEDDH
jgi:hypothetical protein